MISGSRSTFELTDEVGRSRPPTLFVFNKVTAKIERDRRKTWGK
jgi:hypothetical protein